MRGQLGVMRRVQSSSLETLFCYRQMAVGRGKARGKFQATRTFRIRKDGHTPMISMVLSSDQEESLTSLEDENGSVLLQENLMMTEED